MSTLANVNGAMREIGLYAGVDGAVRMLSLDTSDATATAADIAQGKTAYTALGKVIGEKYEPLTLEFTTTFSQFACPFKPSLIIIYAKKLTARYTEDMQYIDISAYGFADGNMKHLRTTNSGSEGVKFDAIIDSTWSYSSGLVNLGRSISVRFTGDIYGIVCIP